MVDFHDEKYTPQQKVIATLELLCDYLSTGRGTKFKAEAYQIVAKAMFDVIAVRESAKWKIRPQKEQKVS